MNLKKSLLVLFFFSASLGHSAEKQDVQSSPPPSSEQTAPSESPAPSIQPVPGEATPAEAPAPLPSSKEMTTSYESAFVRMLVTLLGLVFLIFATFWILRRLGKGKFKTGSGSRVQILERRALSPKSMLYIIQIDNKKVLISESQLEVRALSVIEELPEAED